MATSEEEAVRRAARVLADGLITELEMTPREQAEAAWTPTGPYSVDELEDLIREDRGMPPIDRGRRDADT